MKQFYLTVALCIVGLQCLYSKPIIITGHVAAKFRDTLYLTAHKCIADFVVDETFKKRTIAKVKPDTNGNFRISYEMKGESGFDLIRDGGVEVFGDAFFMPGDSLFVQLVDTEFGGKPYPYPMCHFYGSGAYSILYTNKARRFEYIEGYNLSIDSFNLFIDSLKHAENEFISAYAAQIKLPESFLEQTKINAEYQWKFERLFYLTKHNNYDPNLTVKVNPSYFKFVRLEDLHNEKALNSGYYYLFLYEYPYELWLEKMARLPESVQKERLKSYGKIDLGEQVHIIDSLFTGKFREIAIGKLLALNLVFQDGVDTLLKMEHTKWLDSMLENIRTFSEVSGDSIYTRLILKRNKIFSLDNALAPGFSLSDMKGNVVSLSDFRGKVVLLDFWEVGCIPCMASIPHSNELQDNLKGKDFIMVSICRNIFPEAWKGAITKYKWKGTHLLESSNSNLNTEYSFDGYPHYVLIDKKGIIRNSNAGQDMDDVKKQINKLLDN